MMINIKTRIETYGDQIYISIHGLNMLKDGAECESFTMGMWIFHLWEQKLTANILRQFCLQNYRQHHLSDFDEN